MSPSGAVGSRVGRITELDIHQQVRDDLGLKGGGTPSLFLPEDAEVQFMYLVNPNITVSAASNIVERNVSSDAVTALGGTLSQDGTIIAVPEGATRIVVAFVRTDAGAASTVGVTWNMSWDGTTKFKTNCDQKTASLDVGAGATSVTTILLTTAESTARQNMGLPPFVYAKVENIGAVAITGILSISVH